MSSFKDSTDQKACLLEIISNQIERNYWSKQVDDFLKMGHTMIRVSKESRNWYQL